ncbi:MAG: LysM peptidoglycan-binding domain-containing protein [Bacteroidaceae bacterium]|nr:LysM peptidoglycan-binding domain-containing protein [Bacteroidaceae bacterium]
MKLKILSLLIAALCTSICLAQEIKTHVIGRGETPESVAKKYDVTLEELVKANPELAKTYYVGMKLNIPTSSETTSVPKAAKAFLMSKPKKANAGVSDSENATITPTYSEQDSIQGQKKVNTRRVLDDYSYFAFNYSAPFKAANSGVVGIMGNRFGLGKSLFGISFQVGAWFKGGYGTRYGIGPNFCYPLSEHVFVFVPLQADLYVSFGRKKEKDKWSFGLELLPSLGVKCKKVFVSGGLWFGWTTGSDTVTPGFNVSLGFNV